MTYKIYCITNTINEKQYVGYTSKKVHDRWKQHVYDSKYEHRSMFSNPLQEDVRKYGEDCFTYRVLATAKDKEQAMRLEEEMTIKLGTHAPNGYNRQVGYHCEYTEEAKKKKSESMRGENNPMWGKHLSEEHKKKISESNSGKNHPNYGKHRSEETKKKLYRPVMCVETGVIFMSLTEASRWAGLKSYTSISQCCTGRQKTAGGYHWKYVPKE